MEKQDVLKQIEKVDEIFDNDKINRTIFEILSTSNMDDKKMILKNGSWENATPWFGVDEKNEIYTLLSLKLFSTLVKTCKSSMQENFNLKLERSIWQHMPVDFGDVWIVCMDEIRTISQQNPNISRLNIDFDGIVERVKKTHPNLFVNLKDFIDERQ